MTQFLSATFNAFAFAGAGFVFSKIDHKGYTEEMKRHNTAMEKLTAARDEWNEAKLKELDRVANLRYKKQESTRDIQSTNRDLLSVKSKFDESYPDLSHFYKPSDKMNEYMDFVKFAATIPVLYGVAALIM